MIHLKTRNASCHYQTAWYSRLYLLPSSTLFPDGYFRNLYQTTRTVPVRIEGTFKVKKKKVG